MKPQTENDFPTFLLPHEVAEIFRIKRTTLSAWIKNGVFPPGIKIGKRRLWDQREVLNLARDR